MTSKKVANFTEEGRNMTMKDKTAVEMKGVMQVYSKRTGEKSNRKTKENWLQIDMA